MSEFTAKKLKEARIKASLPLSEVAELMGFSKRKLIMIESSDTSVSTDEIVLFSRIYNVDVKELLLEEFDERTEKECISKENIDFIRIFNRLSEKEKYDIQQILKKWVEEKRC